MPRPLLHPALRDFARVPADRAGIFCDFDGTLSPIVDDPAAAKPVRGAGKVLAALSSRFAVVAVVSGRPVLDLARRLRAPGARLIGLHGLEELHGASVEVRPEAERYRDAAERAVRALKAALRDLSGVTVESKGLALAVHFRRSPNPVEASSLAQPVVEKVAAEEGLAVFGGRLVLELRPPLGGDKGDAVARLIEQSTLLAALAAGDDSGDLRAFEAARTADCSVVVAVASTEAPAVAAAADVIVSSPAELVAILRSI